MYLTKLALVALLSFSFPFSMKKKQTIVFFGDSITEMGVQKDGYINRIRESLKQQQLQDKYEIIGAGIGGNKVYDLYLRLEKDVLEKHPNKVLIYVGVNDVWHKLMGTGTDLDKFEGFYRALIQKMQKNGIEVTLATPLCIGELPNNANPQDADMNKYCDVIRKLSNEYHCHLADLRRMWFDYEKEHNQQQAKQGLLTTDQVHLTPLGSQMVGDAIAKAMEILP